MNKKVLIKNGLVIDPRNQCEGEFDVLIADGLIVEIQKRGALSGVSDVEIIDATQRWVVPGLIDVHVHLREPGFEWKETIATGSQAAVLGGYTSICCMPNTRPVNDSAEITRFIVEKGKAAREGLASGFGAGRLRGARVFPIGAVSLALEGKEMAPFSEMRDAGCVAFSDDGEPVYNSGLMRRALEWCRMLDVPICCHEEDKCLSAGGCMNESRLSTRLGLRGWPKVAEEVMIARDIELARTTGAKVHFCHVSTARGVELIRRAKHDGIPVSAEVTPHHLVLTQERVGEYDTNAKMSPPLREAEDVEALRAGLRDGSIDMIASDHAPHDRDSKEVEFDRAAFGILGLQTSLPLALDLIRQGGLTRLRAFELLSAAPARIFGFQGLGSLGKGSKADVVLVDPEKRWTFSSEKIKSISKNSPFMGQELVGIAETVLIDGEKVVQGASLWEE